MDTAAFDSVEQVIVLPRNGYINRLQAMASSAILANRIGANFGVLWESDSVAPAPIESIFTANSLPQGAFMGLGELNEILPFRIDKFPRYVAHCESNQGDRVVTLAGHDRGEQPLMSELSQVVKDLQPKILVIAAGGRFSMDTGSQPVTWDSPTFRASRASWYGGVKFATEIDSTWSELLGQPTLGLHLRYSDRSHQTPSRGEISKAVGKLVERTGVNRVFVASDSARERERWLSVLRSNGLDAWSYFPKLQSTPKFISGAVAAIIDWRILSQTAGSVFFQESSYGYEASVASGNFENSFGLSPNKLVSLRVGVSNHVKNIAGAPKRLGWIPQGRKPS